MIQQTPLPSHELSLTAYSLTLMWPLSVRDRETGKAGNDDAKKICTAVDGDDFWKKIDDKLRHLRASHDLDSPKQEMTDQEYAEFVYFYPFVQSFLYGKKNISDGNPHITLYRRKSLSGLRVSYEKEKATRTITFDVPRMNLYVFATGDVFLVTEIALPKNNDTPVEEKQEGETRNMPFTLYDAQILNERFRHAYPPYLFGNEQGYSLSSVEWLDDNKPLSFGKSCNSELKKEVWDTSDTPARNPLYAHWRGFLPDLKPKGLRWRQVQDDRMPGVAAIALEHPEKISDADWVRLANFDEPGSHSSYPYAEAFCKEFEKTCFYDRFWDNDADSWKKTRYVSTGFAFTQVVKGKSDSIYHHHQRSMYFQMALISHYHHAALQNLSDQMAHAVDHGIMKEANPENLAEIAEIMRRMLHFTQSFWFREVSNQLQARELFAFIRKPLGVEALYEQVSSETREANAYLNRQEDRRIAEATEFINKVAVTGAVVAGATGFLGMNVLIDRFKEVNQFLVVFLTFMAFTALAVLGYLFVKERVKLKLWWKFIKEKYSFIFPILFLLIAIVVLYCNYNAQ